MILVLLFGAVLVVFAALYARNPAEHRLRFLRGLSHAQAWVMLGGFMGGVRLTLSSSAQLPDAEQPNFHRIVAMGIAESSTVVIMGCALLALAWFIAAIGLRKA